MSLFCLFVCLSAEDRTIRAVDNIIEMPKATDSTFGRNVSMDSPHITPYFFHLTLLIFGR